MLYDPPMPTRLKQKSYQIEIKLAMTCEAKCKPIRKQNIQRMSVAEMRMSRRMFSKIKIIKNEHIRKHLGV